MFARIDHVFQFATGFRGLETLCYYKRSALSRYRAPTEGRAVWTDWRTPAHHRMGLAFAPVSTAPDMLPGSEISIIDWLDFSQTLNPLRLPRRPSALR